MPVEAHGLTLIPSGEWESASEDAIGGTFARILKREAGMTTYPEALLSEDERESRLEAEDFVRWVPRQLILDMDADKIRFPKEYLEEAGRRNLLGLRFPVDFGGRGLPWSAECSALEEIGVLGTSLACLYSLVSMTISILGVPVPYLLMPVALGRNITILLEVAVRNLLLKRKGIFTARTFAQRLQEALEAEPDEP